MLSDLFQREFSKYQLFIIFTRMKNGQSWVLKTMKTQVSHLFVKIGSRTRSLIILHFALNLSARNIVSCMGFTGCESTFCYNLILCLADGYSSKFWTRYLQDQSTGSRQQSLLLKCLSEKWRIAIKWLKLGSNWSFPLWMWLEMILFKETKSLYSVYIHWKLCYEVQTLKNCTSIIQTSDNFFFCSALLWQLMRCNMLQLLKNLRSFSHGKEISDADILSWANYKVKSSGRKSRIQSFKVSGLLKYSFIFLFYVCFCRRFGIFDWTIWIYTLRTRACAMVYSFLNF